MIDRAGSARRNDTRVYVDMRYCPVTDPFGARIIVYCPLADAGTS